jgi:hypothetical protein
VIHKDSVFGGPILAADERATAGDLHFLRLLEILLPAGGFVVVLAEVYVDESGTGSDAPVLSVAGYIFTPDKARALTAEWRKMLDFYGLEYFRMSSCAHSTGPFKGMCVKRCDEIARRAIELTRAYTESGFGVVISRADYEEVVPVSMRGIIGSPYTFCLRLCLSHARHWAETKSGFQGRFAYFFEKGHRDASEADRVLRETYQARPERFRYESHTFVDKREVLALQPADMLAWHWYTHKKRNPSLPPRKDFMALNIDRRDAVIDFSRPKLRDFVDETIKAHDARVSASTKAES